MFYGLISYQNISNRTKGLQKMVGFFFSYDVHLSHACHESAKNFGNIKNKLFSLVWSTFNSTLGYSSTHH